MSPSSADLSGTVVLSEVLSRLVVQTQNPEPRTSPVCCLPGRRCVWTRRIQQPAAVVPQREALQEAEKRTLLHPPPPPGPLTNQQPPFIPDWIAGEEARLELCGIPIGGFCHVWSRAVWLQLLHPQRSWKSSVRRRAGSSGAAPSLLQDSTRVSR